MAYQIPTCEPRAFVAGESVLWTKSLPDYLPADGWTLQYRATNAMLGTEITIAHIAVTANADGTYSVAISPTNSDVGAGEWRLIGQVTLTATGEKHVVFDQVIEVLADAMTVSPANLQTENEKILAAIDARLLGRATADQEQVHINGTTIMRTPLEKLATLRGVYAAKVWHEQNPGRSSPVHKMRFARVH